MDCNKGFHFEYPYLVGSPWDEEAEPRLLSDDTAMPMILPTTPAETDLTEMSAAVARCSSGNWTPLQYACPSPKEGAPAILSLAPWKALAISLQVLATVSGRSTRLISLSWRSAAILHPLRIKDLAPSSMLGQFQRRRKNNLCRWASGDTSAPWTNDSGKMRCGGQQRLFVAYLLVSSWHESTWKVFSCWCPVQTWRLVYQEQCVEGHSMFMIILLHVRWLGFIGCSKRLGLVL